MSDALFRETVKTLRDLAANHFRDSDKVSNPKLRRLMELRMRLYVIWGDSLPKDTFSRLSPEEQEILKASFSMVGEVARLNGLADPEFDVATVSVSIGFAFGYAYHKRFGDLWDLPPWEPEGGDDKDRGQPE